MASVQAQPFRSREDALGIGPPSEPTACGEALVLRDLPVGLQVTVKAWASDGFDNRFVGWSDPVTVASDHEATATVRLEAAAPPEIASLSPEPVVLPADGGPVAVAVHGQGFEAGAGLAYVEAGGARLPSEGWSDTEVTATVSAPVATSQARVVACGAASAPAPLRVLPVAAGQRRIDLGGACADARLVDLHANPDGRAVAALSCAGGDAGALLPMTLAPGACALGISPWSLDAAPQALALDSDGAAWVAQGLGVTRWDLDTGALATTNTAPNTAVVSTQGGGGSAAVAVTALATWPTAPSEEQTGWLFALTSAEDGSTTLVGAPLTSPVGADGTGDGEVLLTPIPGVGAGLQLRGLAATRDELLLVAAPAHGAGPGATGRLARLQDPAAGFPEEWPLPDCAEPVSVATSPDATAGAGWAAVACAGTSPGLVAVPLGGAPADARHIDLGLGAGVLPTAARLDAVGTVALVRAGSSDGASLTAVDLPGTTALRTWPVWDAGSAQETGQPADATTLTSFGGPDRAVLAGPGPASLTVFAPYDDADPCAALEGAP